jgi:Spy/CpxP family protein refolding chaperone
MNTFRIGLFLGAVLAFASAASAQNQEPFLGMSQWWDRPIVRNLGLSDDQFKQIRAVVRESRDRLIELRAAVRKAEADLKDEMDEEKVDMKRAESAIERVIAARSELIRAVSVMSLKLRVILTPAQWQELEKRRIRPASAPGLRGGGAGRKADRGVNRPDLY